MGKGKAYKQALEAAGRTDTVEKYFDVVRGYQNPVCENLTRFPKYENGLKHTASTLPPVFLRKDIIVNDDLSEYRFEEIAKDGDTFSKVIRLMQWLTDNTYYNGATLLELRDKTSEILRSSVGKGFDRALCCRYKAIALTDICLSLGIKALPLFIYGVTPTVEGKPLWGCHFVTHVYLRETDQWILVDPSFNTYFQYQGKLLNALEVRECFASGATPEICGYNFNGSTTECFEQYRETFVKGCLEFIRTWESGKRKFLPFQKKFNCKFDYLLEPSGLSICDAFIGAGIRPSIAKQWAKSMTKINADDFLAVE